MLMIDEMVYVEGKVGYYIDDPAFGNMAAVDIECLKGGTRRVYIRERDIIRIPADSEPSEKERISLYKLDITGRYEDGMNYYMSFEKVVDMHIWKDFIVIKLDNADDIYLKVSTIEKIEKCEYKEE